MGTPKSSILMSINHPVWGTPIYGNHHIFVHYCTEMLCNCSLIRIDQWMSMLNFQVMADQYLGWYFPTSTTASMGHLRQIPSNNKKLDQSVYAQISSNRLPSGKLTQPTQLWKMVFLKGRSTISMAMFKFANCCITRGQQVFAAVQG